MVGVASDCLLLLLLVGCRFLVVFVLFCFVLQFGRLVCLVVCLLACFFVCLLVCLLACLLVCLFVCLLFGWPVARLVGQSVSQLVWFGLERFGWLLLIVAAVVAVVAAIVAVVVVAGCCC